MRPLILAVLASAAACGSPKSVSEPSTVLPEFAMTAVGPSAERPFGRADLLGRVWVADFVFTRCGGPCPMLSERMRGLAASLPAEVGLLTITVDPEADTPERLRAYARRYGADDKRWVFLRGTMPETYRLVYAGFRLPLSVDPAAAPELRATHSARLVLVGKDGSIRGYYDGLSELDTAALARDARRLLEADS